MYQVFRRIMKGLESDRNLILVSVSLGCGHNHGCIIQANYGFGHKYVYVSALLP